MKSLYGPLLACLTTSRSAFDAMLKQHSPDGTREALVSAIHTNPGGHEGEAYRCRLTVDLPHFPYCACQCFIDHLRAKCWRR